MLKKNRYNFLLIALCFLFLVFGAYLAPVSQMQTSTLISETFSVSASNFTVVRGGTWTVTSGTYRLTNPDNSFSIGNGNISVHNTNVAGDFVLTSDASVASTSNAFNDFSILFGYQDTNNYYFASYNESNDPNTSGIFRVSGGTQTQIADITNLFTATTLCSLRRPIRPLQAARWVSAAATTPALSII